MTTGQELQSLFNTLDSDQEGIAISYLAPKTLDVILVLSKEVKGLT